MSLKHIEEYRDPKISQKIVDNIKKISTKPIRLMEVCGTHTVSIFRSGMRSLLPDTIMLLSGPGCPVCVTTLKEIDSFIEIARQKNVILTTFGDLIRVPGSSSSLQKEQSQGRDIRIIYSSLDALKIAQKNPAKKIIFFGVGFETTAPTIAASITVADHLNLDNFYVYSSHKLVPPALYALMQNVNARINGFILPGHVSVIIGMTSYKPFFDEYHIPCVVAGFEPMDILQAIFSLTQQIEKGEPMLENRYSRAVTENGNNKARQLMDDVFEPKDTEWRGIGTIPKSGLKIKERYQRFDAEKMMDFEVPLSENPRGCDCGEILMGTKIPPECTLFKKVCTPVDPVGPCMVSGEGTCAAYYRYHK